MKGELVQRVEYTPFGKERFVLNASLEELPKYTGQIDDIETDLYYYGSRYYDSVLGRFIQPDSIIPDAYSSQALNGYSYVLGNPLRYNDPFGYAASERDNYKGELAQSELDDPTDQLAEDNSEHESGTVVGVGYEDPAGVNRFGHSYLVVEGTIYEVNSASGSSLSDVIEKKRDLATALADERGEEIVDLPVTEEQKEQLKMSLEKTSGRSYDYNYFTCNCSDFVEERLREIGVNLPRNDRLFGIDTPKGTLEQARAYREGKLYEDW